jgi:peptidyl-prolyl cis-trans isomerase D
MQFFRNAAKPMILVTTIAFFIWLVYDLSGLGGGGGLLTKTSVGKVNGISVDARSFQARVQQATEARQRQSGASLSLDELAEVRNQVWEQEIQDIIFRAEYRKHGLSVSSEEILAAIRTSPLREIAQDPQFQTDGQFDLAKYQRWLSSASGSAYVPLLESRYSEELLRGKLLRGVIGDVYLSDAALWERYRDEKEIVKVGALIIAPGEAIEDQAAPASAQEAENYYRDHRDEFKRPRTAWISFIAVPRLPDASDTAAALARIAALKDEIAKGAPFAEVAKRESADTVSGAAGGELGELKRNAVDPGFAGAAMALPLKTLSDPVRSGFGFHLIEVESRKGDSSFKARHILIPIEVTGSHRDLLDRRADSLEQLAAEHREPSALDTAARALNLPILHAGPLTEGNRLTTAEAGSVPDLGVWAFQAEAGEESPVIEAQTAFVVARLDSARAEGIPSFAAIRTIVEERVRAQKKRAAAMALGAKLAGEARKGLPLKQLAQGKGVAYRELGPFSRLTATLAQPSLIGAAFGAGKGAVAGPVLAEDGVYLFEGLEHTPADSADFAKNLAAVRSQALTAARQSRVRAYMLALRAGAKVVDHRAEIFKTGAQNAAASNNARVP